MIMDLMKKHRFVGILRHIPLSFAMDAVKAMYDGGIRIFEITFDPRENITSKETCQIIHLIRSTYGEDVGVGAGTVLTPENVDQTFAAGGEFIVAPCADEKVISLTKEKGMISIPGAYTPTEIVKAYEMGADVVKIFPIGPGDIGYLKNVISPLSHIPFMITGGINPDTIKSFLETGPVAVAAGATIVTEALVRNGEFDQIYRNALAHTEKIR